MKLFREYEFHVLEAQPEDYPVLENIHAQSFDRAWSIDELTSTLAVKGTQCFVANIRGKSAKGAKGFVILRTLAGQSEILTIATDPAYRKRGIARLLLEYAIRRLQAERVGQLFLEVAEDNGAALRLYQSLKFKRIATRKAYYRNRGRCESEGAEKVNALVMQLELR